MVLRFGLRLALALAGVCSESALASQPTSQVSLHFKAKGVVCALCVQSLKKHLLTEPGVRSVEIDLKSRQVTLGVEPGRAPPQERIRTLVEESGFGYDDASEPTGK